ncbi:MAG: heme o synthase [Acidimicrobiia bacterium]
MTGPLAPSRPSTLRAYVELTKPRIIELLLITTIPAMVVAANGWPGLDLVLVALIGGSLSAGGANVINQVYDSDIDRSMSRTQKRPLPTGRVSLRQATWFGIALGVGGFVVLAGGANLLAGILAAAAFIGYVLGYTMVLKRSTTQNIVLGGAAGSVPALIGWAVYTGGLAPEAWFMFAVVFFWTPSHFWALSLKYQEDYRAASVPMLPVVVGIGPTLTNILWYAVIMAGVAIMLIPVGGLGWIYAATTVTLCGLSVAFAARLRRNPNRAMPYFVFTNLVLAGVFLAIMLDRLAATPSLGHSYAWMTVASTIVGIGVVGVVSVESGKGMRAPGISVLRHGIEVGATVAFVGVMVLVGWQSVVAICVGPCP